MGKKLNFNEIFLSCLGSGKKLKWEIDNNINLVHYAKQNNGPLFSLINFFTYFVPKYKKQELFKDVSSRSIMDLLEKERPDIHKKIMEHSHGINWVDNQIINFKKELL